MDKLYQKYCTTLAQSAKYRSLPKIISREGLLDFSSNDYLNLSRSPEVLQAAYQAAEKYGMGATGSRLLSGNSSLFEDFESQIALDKGTEAALILNSGFQTNLTVLASLLDQAVLQAKPLVFFDRLNHASLYEAVTLSQAELVRYHHADMTHLEKLLKKFQAVNRPKFIVTETLFGMDGDIAPLQDIINLAQTHNAFLYLDEAHSMGLLGKNGYGLSTLYDLTSLSCVIMGTFSKALGGFGAYIACSQGIKEYIINRCSGFKYSTALSPMLIGAAAKAWSLIPSYESARQLLLSRADDLRQAVHRLGFNTGHSTTSIIPLIGGNEHQILAQAQHLLTQGIRVSAIRPPTVPPGSSRLRLALTTQHQPKDIEKLLQVLATL